jgi:hypothetical protein
LIRQATFLTWGLWVPLTALALIAQEKTAPSPPRPAPQVTGRLIGTDGARRLSLQYKRSSKYGMFTGTIHSTCMLPAPSKSGEGKPLKLSAIPIGTIMTAYYVSRALGKHTENVIMEIRIDRLPGSGSMLPRGVNIPCFKGEPAH